MGLWRVPNSDIQRAFLAKEISHGRVFVARRLAIISSGAVGCSDWLGVTIIC